MMNEMKDGMMKPGNMLHLDERAYPDAQDGEEVETTVKGKLSIKDGMKMLQVTEADGLPVSGMASEAPKAPEEQEMDAKMKLSEEIGKSYGKNMFTEDEEEEEMM